MTAPWDSPEQVASLLRRACYVRTLADAIALIERGKEEEEAELRADVAALEQHGDVETLEQFKSGLRLLEMEWEESPPLPKAPAPNSIRIVQGEQ